MVDADGKPPDLAEAFRQTSLVDGQPPKKKTCSDFSQRAPTSDREWKPPPRKCYFFASGTCRYGAECPFLHDDSVSGELLCCVGDTCIPAKLSSPAKFKASGFKTKLCADFTKTGTCPNTDCYRAHGVDELLTPSSFKGSAGYKRMLCTYHTMGTVECFSEEESHLCAEAHGALDLRRKPISPPLCLSIAKGSRLTCTWRRVEIWQSAAVWEAIGALSAGNIVTAAGPPEISNGYWMVPIEPEGAVESRAFKVQYSSKDENNSSEASFDFSDAHIHLDHVILSRRYGSQWYYKTERCSNGACPYQSQCVFAHSEEELIPRPVLKVSDFEAFIAELNAIPMCSFAGCVQSCSGLPTIEDTLRLVAWGRTFLRGQIYASFGVHPTNFEQYTPEVEARLEAALDECGPQGVAWGECGLDYNKRTEQMEKDPAVGERMRDVFRRQARVAVRRGLPLIVHSRDAESEVFEILTEVVPRDHPVHLHSYMGAPALLMDFLRDWPNCYVGIAGAITWPVAIYKAGGLADLARLLPLDRLLLETDGPFMAPVPHRGEESHPGFIPLIAAGVASARCVSPSTVLAATHANFCRLYRVPAPQ